MIIHTRKDFLPILWLTSHAEGNSTKTIGTNTHAEGTATVAGGILRNNVIGFLLYADFSQTITFQYLRSTGHFDPLFTNFYGNNINVNAMLVSTDSSVPELFTITLHLNTLVCNISDNTVSCGISPVTMIPSPITHGYVMFNLDDNFGSTGDGAHSAGIATVSVTSYSTSEGISTIAYGSGSHVEGSSSISAGLNTHAEGLTTWASGDNSHTEGNATFTGTFISTGNYNSTSQFLTLDNPYYGDIIETITISTNIGITALYNIDTSKPYGPLVFTLTDQADSNSDTPLPLPLTDLLNCFVLFGLTNGSTSHAEGLKSMAIGDNSHAEGSGTTAFGLNSHTEGTNTTAFAEASHAEGYYNTTNGIGSHVEGGANISGYLVSFPLAQFTIMSGNSYIVTQSQFNYTGLISLLVGCQFIFNYYHFVPGSSNDDSIPAVLPFNTYIGTIEAVTTIPNGNAFEYIIQFDSTGSGLSVGVAGSFAVKQNHFSYPINFAHVEGVSNVAIANASHVEGFANTSYGKYSHVEGSFNFVSANGEGAHAEGSSNTVTGSNSHAEGNSNVIIGQSSHVEGTSNSILGDSNHAEGSGNISNGSSSHAEGTRTSSLGIATHSEGLNTVSEGYTTHTEGNTTYANGDGSHAEGVGSVAGYNFILPNSVFENIGSGTGTITLDNTTLNLVIINPLIGLNGIFLYSDGLNIIVFNFVVTGVSISSHTAEVPPFDAPESDSQSDSQSIIETLYDYIVTISYSSFLFPPNGQNGNMFIRGDGITGNTSTTSGTMTMAYGDSSEASGKFATAYSQNCYVWCDGQSYLTDRGPYTYNIQATGGFNVYTTADQTIGMELSPDGNLIVESLTVTHDATIDGDLIANSLTADTLEVVDTLTVDGNLIVDGYQINYPVVSTTLSYANNLPTSFDLNTGALAGTNTAGSFMLIVNNSSGTGATAVFIASRSTASSAGVTTMLTSATYDDIPNTYIASLNITWQANAPIQLYHMNTGAGMASYNARIVMV